MAGMPTSDTTSTDLLPQSERVRFGLRLGTSDFDVLGRDLDRIRDAERSAEIAASALRLF